MATRITEKKRIDVVHCAPDNPVCLAWVGPLGGWNYWVFGKTQTQIISAEIQSDVLRSVDDLENADTFSDVVSKGGLERWVLGVSNCPVVKIRGLRTLLTSPKVMREISGSSNPADWKWQTVRVLGGDFPVEDTAREYWNLEIQIALQPMFLQSQ